MAPIPDQARKLALRWYLLGFLFWFTPLGIQAVLYPWLLVVHLNLPPDQVGFGQMALTLPAFFLVLIGGALADRLDGRKVLFALHILAAIPALALAWAVAKGHFSFTVLVCYGLAMGAITAFMNPARESLLTQVAGDNVQRTVILATAVQFGVQILGYLLASQAGWVGPAPILVLQACIILAGTYVASQLTPQPANPRRKAAGSRLQAILGGVPVARASPRIWPVLVLSFAGGCLYLGAFVVIVPLMIRQIYQGSAPEMALANICFMLGTVASTVFLLRRGGITRVGRAYTLAHLWGGTATLLCLALGPPYPVMLLAMFTWGAGAGVGMSMGRTLLQENAPAAYRARILSLYQFGAMGGAPIGAVLTGYLVKLFGLSLASLLPTLVMVSILAWVVRASGIWFADRPR